MKAIKTYFFNLNPIITLFSILFLFNQCSFSQIGHKTHFKSALNIEILGNSPFASANYEHTFNDSFKSFSSVRAGIGFVAGSIKPNVDGKHDSGVSFPLAFSHHILLNNLKKQFKYKLSSKCRPAPPRIMVESFGEFGLGFTPVFTTVQEPRQFYFGIIGIRNQVVFNIPPKPKVVFLRLLYTPYFYKNKLVIIPMPGRGFVVGASLGMSI
jgi:hypothetical protein